MSEACVQFDMIYMCIICSLLMKYPFLISISAVIINGKGQMIQQAVLKLSHTHMVHAYVHTTNTINKYLI